MARKDMTLRVEALENGGGGTVLIVVEPGEHEATARAHYEAANGPVPARAALHWIKTGVPRGRSFECA